MTKTIYLRCILWNRLDKEKELTGKTVSQIIKEALEKYFQEGGDL